jgi:DNA-binding response OmpR family regulator
VASQDEVAQLESAGADGFIKKPFDVERLMNEVEGLLGF